MFSFQKKREKKRRKGLEIVILIFASNVEEKNIEEIMEMCRLVGVP